MSIINYSGINKFDINLYNYYFPFSIDGTIKINDTIDEVLSFSTLNEVINYDEIETFELSNLENYQLNSRLAYINTKFSLVFEYGVENTQSINVIEEYFFKSFIFPVDSCCYNITSINLFIKDLYCKKVSENILFYNIHIGIAII